MRNKYKDTFAMIKNIIDEQDPINLLVQGAPKDEYDHEIQKIVSGLQMCNSVEEIQKLIYNIFKENFGEKTAGNLDLYLEPAKKIFMVCKI